MCVDVRERKCDMLEQLKDAPAGWIIERRQENSLPG